MPDAVAYFAIRLLLGMSVVGGCLAFAKPPAVSAYFRIQMLVVLGLSVLFGLAHRAETLGAALLGTTAFVASVFWLLERRAVATGASLLLIPLAAIESFRTLPLANPSAVLPAGLQLGSCATSALTLGAAMSGMLLGHRYLTAPGMSLRPLEQANGYLLGAGLGRLVLSTWGLFFGWQTLSQPAFAVWLSLRWLAGVIGPLVVWYMVRRILVHRNTQSATGVLFVGVILTFLGELTADVLFRILGIPF
jgi:hypothetical protein